MKNKKKITLKQQQVRKQLQKESPLSLRCSSLLSSSNDSESCLSHISCLFCQRIPLHITAICLECNKSWNDVRIFHNH